MPRKLSHKYYFSVEGYTELWYLQWLQKTINNYPASKINVAFDCKVEKDPVSRVKQISITGKTIIYHLFDYEGPANESNFRSVLKKMRDSQKQGKSVKYVCGYSNISFDLWILLHKKNLRASLFKNEMYIKHINEVFDSDFDSMKEYKKESSFQYCLNKLTINDVINAIERAEEIYNANVKQYTCKEYCGYTYYEENPSTNIYIHIKSILRECGIL